MSSNKLLEPYKTNIINAIQQQKAEAYCNKCGDTLYEQSKGELTTQIEESKKAIWQAMTYIPVISAQNPQNWDYDVLTMVTGQSVTGTGVLSEFFSSWTDLVGAQSGSYNTKLKAGENLCFAQLRRQALDLGGNAVIATDIDYSEVGGDKGMLMVCMAGTAVRVRNTDIFSQTRNENLTLIYTLRERLSTLRELVTPETHGESGI